MADLEYPACTRELYESEIVGESLFLALVQEAKTPRDRYHFGTLLQLESETKARLRPLLYRDASVPCRGRRSQSCLSWQSPHTGTPPGRNSCPSMSRW